jgi:hypothetical protein
LTRRKSFSSMDLKARKFLIIKESIIRYPVAE